MAHRIAWLDVFAERPLAGNGLAVVDDADGIADETMLAFAREMGLSETTFVQSPGADGADYRNRIFTVAGEIPFAGHPSLGTAVAVARWRGLQEASFVQETQAGLQPIELRAEEGRWRAEMVQNAPEFGTELDVEAVMHAVGLNPAEAHQDLPPQVVSTGLPTAIVPVSDASSLERITPDYEAIDAALADAEPRAGRDAELLPRLGGRGIFGGAGPHVLARGARRRGPRDRIGGRSAGRLPLPAPESRARCDQAG